MATLSSHGRRFTLIGHCRLFQRKAAGWFHCRTKNYWKAGGDSAQHPTMSIGVGGNPFATVSPGCGSRNEMVVVLTTSHRDTSKADSVFNPQNRWQAEKRFGKICFDFIKDRLTQTGGDVGCNDLCRSADGIALLSDLLDQFDHLSCG